MEWNLWSVIANIWWQDEGIIDTIKGKKCENMTHNFTSGVFKKSFYQHASILSTTS